MGQSSYWNNNRISFFRNSNYFNKPTKLKTNKVMELKCRLTHNLAEIKVDEIETTLFKSHPKEIDDMIQNLSDVIDDLNKLKQEALKEDPSSEYATTAELMMELGKSADESLEIHNDLEKLLKEESKQETLIEVAKRLSSTTDEFNQFVAGAKWQEQRMYSEEEVKLIVNEMIKSTIDNIGNPFYEHHDSFDEIKFNELLKQFKNK